MKNRLFAFLILMFTLAGVVAKTDYVRKTNLPTVYLETFDGTSINSKTVYKYCRLIYVDEQDSVCVYDSVSVRGRGNSTWNMSKKPYRIKFLNKEKFLGKGYAKAKSWNLMANAGDKTMIRNAVTSSMGEFLGLKFNPAYKFVDLVLNGTYNGTYQISDQVEVRAHRVNIAEQDYPLNEQSDITGGYLMEVDGFHDGNCFSTSRYGVYIRLHYPDEDEVVSEQNSYIRNYIRDFETVLSSPDFADPRKGYRHWVDSVSLANWFIATEVSANIDGYYSTYFYKDAQDSLLYWGPLWDYDIAYDNDYRIPGTATKLMTNDGYGDTKKWLNRMWEDPWFCRLIAKRYQEAEKAGLQASMFETIDSLSELLQQSQELNYQKWGISRRMYHENVLYSSYDQYVEDVKSFITNHTDYLRTEFANRKPAEPTPPFAPEDYYYSIANKGNGKVLSINDNTSVCIWDKALAGERAQWEIIQNEEGYYLLVNRLEKRALNDPTQGDCTPTTNTGTQLNIAECDSDDYRQQWLLTPQGTDGYYNITNRHTQHTANLSGGGSNNGTAVLSYDTNDRNATSNNRLWTLVAMEKIPRPVIPEDTIPADTIISDSIPTDTIPTDTIPTDTINTDTIPSDTIITEPDAIAELMPEPVEYALAHNPMLQQLHFGSATPELLTFVATVVDAGRGAVVGSFRADETFSTANLPRGIYIVTWKVGGKQRSTKFLLQ